MQMTPESSSAARKEARNNFDQNRRVGVDTGMQINHALEVANILRHNIVQGAREDGDEAAKWGTFSALYDLFFDRWHLSGCEIRVGYGWVLTGVSELRIHDEIERGDNDSIKVGNKDVKIHKACSS
ncbi:Mitochondrial zinc maintenance protein 1 [Penicillium chermesinum]|uniref:Mitochondrial zinc maintenance protein 1 n=1 Tax=Penicillium chermesinum TaxID=63820 RepID=A0A9W9TEG6_9EURO|nr:Mitochondrial zinc maintenance protein 1 [Penicillium chermesinum]KAJ5219663.1 Mitochondrial zinc maintenance protein 1 [Penicillium chermesinum]